MRFSTASTLALAGLASAAPSAQPKGYSPYPLADGFPTPSKAQIAAIQKRAGGTLPNGPLPPNPNSPAAALDLQVVATNEIFEVAYFTQLLKNVTDNKPGYQIPSSKTGNGKEYVEKLLKEVIAQEELHALLANTALTAYGGKAITPARYAFPVNTLLEALDFAGLFTSVVLGALQSVSVDASNVKSPGLVQTIASIIGQEGEQTGFYRAVNGRVASASPFLTNVAGQFAYNALLQNVIVPGSDTNNVPIPHYDALTLACAAQPKDSVLDFALVSKTAPTAANYITYNSGQNIPVSEPITNIKSVGAGKYTFQAKFPFTSKGFANGITIAALTKGKDYANSSATAAGTTAGPGLIYLL